MDSLLALINLQNGQGENSHLAAGDPRDGGTVKKSEKSECRTDYSTVYGTSSRQRLIAGIADKHDRDWVDPAALGRGERRSTNNKSQPVRGYTHSSPGTVIPPHLHI